MPANFYSYSPSDGHGLKYSPFKALIGPRPIGWISSISKSGMVNLAPYSFFNAFCETPPIIGFTSFGEKDSLRNISETGEFVHNCVSSDLAEKMNLTSGNYPNDINEMAEAGLAAIPSDDVTPPRVASALAAMECKLIEVKRMEDRHGEKTNCHLVLGEVVRIHISEKILTDGLVDEEALGLLGRLGYFNYTKVDDVFAMRRPKF